MGNLFLSPGGCCCAVSLDCCCPDGFDLFAIPTTLYCLWRIRDTISGPAIVSYVNVMESHYDLTSFSTLEDNWARSWTGQTIYEQAPGFFLRFYNNFTCLFKVVHASGNLNSEGTGTGEAELVCRGAALLGGFHAFVESSTSAAGPWAIYGQRLNDGNEPFSCDPFLYTFGPYSGSGDWFEEYYYQDDPGTGTPRP